MKYELRFGAAPGKSCGGCTLCCDLLPVSELKKAKNTPCIFMGQHGCDRYASRPHSCREWSCRWLTNEELPEGLKPSTSHVIFDQLPDVIRSWPNGPGVGTPDEILCVQVWVDPKFPEAYRGEAVKREIARIADQDNLGAIIRIGERGLVVFANDGRWVEIESVCKPEKDFEDARARLAGWAPG